MKELTSVEFKTLVSNKGANSGEWKFLGEKPCVVDFYASWCGPCKMLAPILEEVAQMYADKVDIYKVNTESERTLSSEFQIRSIPTLMFCPMQGNPQFKLGAMSAQHLKQNIESILLGEVPKSDL